MICSICHGPVTWQGPITNLTHTQCGHCGAINSQLPDDEEQEILDTRASQHELALTRIDFLNKQLYAGVK